MNDQANNSQADSDTVNGLVRCPHCRRDWQRGCEQSVAIRKRGKCIVCIVQLGENIEMEPYEFPSEIDETPNNDALRQRGEKGTDERT